MINITKKQIKDLQNGEKSSKDLAMELVEQYPAIDIAIAYVEEALCNTETKEETPEVAKIRITEEQLKKFFKVKDPNSKVGRPKKGSN